jgi:head-tail adaptor
MRAGLLRERVTVRELVAVQSSLSTRMEFRDVYVNIPARLVHLGGSKELEGDAVVEDYRVRFELRYHFRERLRATMRIVHGGNVYQIVNIEVRRERQDVAVTCRIIDEEV